jgi:hypothetical protein
LNAAHLPVGMGTITRWSMFRSGQCAYSDGDGIARARYSSKQGVASVRGIFFNLLIWRRELKDGIPVVKCFPTGRGQVKFWCPYCEKWHIHGYDDKITRSKIIGHWQAHCHVADSPYKEKGVYLKPFTKQEIATISESANYYGT